MKEYFLQNDIYEKLQNSSNSIIELGNTSKASPKAVYSVVDVTDYAFAIRRQTKKTMRKFSVNLEKHSLRLIDENTKEEKIANCDNLSSFFSDLSDKVVNIQYEGKSPCWIRSLECSSSGIGSFIKEFVRLTTMPKELCFYEYHWYRTKLNTNLSKSSLLEIKDMLLNYWSDEEIRRAFSGANCRSNDKCRTYIDSVFSYKNYAEVYSHLIKHFGQNALILSMKLFAEGPFDTSSPFENRKIFLLLMELCPKLGIGQENYVEFFDYLLVDSVRQGYANNMSTFVHEWLYYLNQNLSLHKDGKNIEIYPQHLKSEVMVLQWLEDEKKREKAS